MKAIQRKSQKHESFSYVDAALQNGGIPPAALASEHITPTPLVFTRSHGNIPAIEPTAWRLMIRGLVEHELEFSLAELKTQFPIHEVTATLICAGLRRDELLRVAPLPGELPWSGQPIANVRWRGVSLRDVLARVSPLAGVQHVEFIGADDVERHGEIFGFGASIPLDKANDRDVVLAFKLDGEALPPEHGFPVRAVVPGWIGARSVKWLSRIELIAEPSQNYFRTHAYRVLRTAHAAAPLDVSAGETLEEIALNSMILTPEAGSVHQHGELAVSGWAIGPNAEAPSRVEVSADGGKTWQSAEIRATNDRWSWRLWDTAFTLATGEHELVVRAFDQAGRMQPEHAHEVWNVKGYANNAWHRVRVNSEQ